MKTGLAIWHYPHRTGPENIRFFAARGYEAISQVGSQFIKDLEEPRVAAEYARAIRESGVTFTVHHCLPASHKEEKVAAFYRGIDAIARWQAETGLIEVLSFDVPRFIRPRIRPYVDYVVAHVRNTRIALEDFCLNPEECQEVAHLQGNPNFGILMDVGHLYIRIRGKNPDGRAVFSHSDLECPQADIPGEKDLLAAFRSKPFPIFEIHMHSNDGVRDLHWFLQEGMVDTPMVAGVLKKLGYSGIVTIESAPGYMFPCAGADADAGIAQTKALWDAALKK